MPSRGHILPASAAHPKGASCIMHAQTVAAHNSYPLSVVFKGQSSHEKGWREKTMGC
jgi:hypothetical protein